MTPTDALLDVLAQAVADKVASKLQQQPVSIGPRLLTIDQTATYLSRTKEAVQHLVASGKIPTVRSDRRVFIDVRDLDSWIADNKS